MCSSIIDAILIALPSVVESNWKSIAHNTFGAFASTTGPEDTPAAHENCGTATDPAWLVGLNAERHQLCCNMIAHSLHAGHSQTIAEANRVLIRTVVGC